MKRCQLPLVINIANIKCMVYIQKLSASAESSSANIRSILKTRHDLPTSDLFPVPFFYIEKRAFLGQTSWQAWQSLVCHHDRLLINYYDIYDVKQYRNILYAGEHDNISSSRILRYERQMVDPKSVFYNKILLGVTMLPKPIAEALLEDDPAKLEIFRMFCGLWSPVPCFHCHDFYQNIKRKRIVERYLFLRYQTYLTGTITSYKTTLKQ